MATVIHRETKQILYSVNTPDYTEEIWVINPDFSNVDGVPQKYWKISGDSIVEMTQEEKSVVDAAELVEYKNLMLTEISNNSPVVLERDGFEFDSYVFPLTKESREQYLMLASMKSVLQYPLLLDKKDETLPQYSILDEQVLDSFLLTVMGYANSVIDAGEALKADIRAATSKEEVDAVIDNR